MILAPGYFVLVVHRRLFDGDQPRFFLGTVDAYEGGIAKVTGQSWIRDAVTGVIVPKEGSRTKIFSISSGTLIVYQLPASLDLALLRFDTAPDGRVTLIGEPNYSIDLSDNEHIPQRRAA